MISDGSLEKIQKIFDVINDHVVDLITDPFGHYLVPKLFKAGNEDQRMQILNLITKERVNFLVFTISYNQLGTLSVQHIIQSLQADEHQLFSRL